MITYLEVEKSMEHSPISNSETGARELQGKKKLSKATGTKKKTKWLNVFEMGFKTS